MFEAFNREFKNLDSYYEHELTTLDEEGSVYAYFFLDGDIEAKHYKIKLKPSEIVELVDAYTALDKFYEKIGKDHNSDSALDSLSNLKIRNRVENYNKWAIENNVESQQFCPAAFLGDHLENLLCGDLRDRYEIVESQYTEERYPSVKELLNNFQESTRFITNRKYGRPSYEIGAERDIHDLLYFAIKCFYPDAKYEDPSPLSAGKSNVIDIVIPKVSTVIEVKFVRDAKHSKTVADELKTDIESYHNHPCCKLFIAFVWDPQSLIIDRPNFIDDLSGSRNIDGKTFVVDIIIKP